MFYETFGGCYADIFLRYDLQRQDIDETIGSYLSRTGRNA